MSDSLYIAPWTAEETDKLFQLVAEGYSMSAIGKALHRSRSSCMGRYSREAGKRGHIIASKARREAAKNMPLEPIAKPPRRVTLGSNVILLRPLPPPPVRVGPAVGLLDVTGCKFPVAENAELIGGWEFCNHKRDGERVYCEHHSAVAYRKFVPKPVKSLGAIGLRFRKGAS